MYTERSVTMVYGSTTVCLSQQRSGEEPGALHQRTGQSSLCTTGRAPSSLGQCSEGS